MTWSHSLVFAVILVVITFTSAKSLNSNESLSSDSELSKIPIVQEIEKQIGKLINISKKYEAARRLNLDYGQLQQSADEILPEPVMISSQPITVNTRKTAGSLGIKRSRSIPLETNDGIKVIEGVRVPDNEEDKFHTWRNARVINGRLVPKDRSPQPHKKRQIMVQDATQYLAEHGMSVPQFQQMYQQQNQNANQYGSAIDPSTYQAMAQAAAAATQQQNAFYAQRPEVQPTIYAQDLSTGALYATASPVLSKHAHTPIQTVTAVPVVFQDGQIYSTAHSYPINTQFHARTGVEIQAQVPNTEQSQLKPVSNPHVSIHSPSSPKQPQIESAAATADFKPMPAIENSPQIQQIVTPENQQTTSSIILPQGATTLIQTQHHAAITQQMQQQQLNQFAHAQQLGSQSQHVAQLIHAQQQQQLEAQSQQAAQQVQSQVQSLDSQQQQQLATQVIQVQQQPVQQMHQVQLDPQGHLSQIMQIQPQQHSDTHTTHMYQQIQGQPTAYILSPSASPDILEERNSHVYPSTSNQRYIIRPQTYVTGPGGQVFTVPVPIPTEEEDDDPHHQLHQKQIQHRNRERDETPGKKERPASVLMHKVMDAFAANRKTIERVETNIALPVLATTGVLLGLGALAAGWYLSSQNREVGYMRRTGKPQGNTGSGVNIKRIRRQAAETDQAGFFQSIIQHAIEKQQKEFEETPELTTTPATSPSRKPFIKNRGQMKPANSRHDETEFLEKGSHGHHSAPVKHWKKPAKSSFLGSRQALKFAKVAIPALILGGAVIGIGALIFGWYISGSNREIAFLEPSAYSRRRKRDLTTSFDDSWILRLLSSIHNNPYGANGSMGSDSPYGTTNRNSLMNFDHEPDKSKGNDFDSKTVLSHSVVAVSLASVAFLTMMALVVAWFFAENDRTNRWLENGAVGYGGWPNHYRTVRSVNTNSIAGPDLGSTLNPGFLASILTDLEVSHSRILKRLQETGYSKWQETPCAKRIFCDVMSTQSDDTIRAMEKRMVTFVSMLPNSLSSSLSTSLGDVMRSIHKKDCSSFTCKGLWVDSSNIDQPSPPVNQPR